MKAKSRWTWLIIGVYGVIVIVMFSGFIFTDKMFFGTDMVPMGYMMRKVVADYWREHGRLPLWDPYILSGLPVVDAMHGDLFYPASLFYLLMPLHRALGYKIVLHVWIAGLTMFFLLRTLGLRRSASFLGGLAYMTAPYLVSLAYAGHDAKMFVTALFPLCVMLLERLIRKPDFLRGALFGGSIGLLFLTSHPQMTYFSSWGLAIYFVVRLPAMRRDRKILRTFTFLLVGLILGGAIGSIQILPAYYYTTNFSPRTGGVSFEYAASWSLHPEEIASLLYPSFGGYLDSYWGRNPFKLNAESPGPLILILAIAGLVIAIRRRELVGWLILFIFCPLYALGAHTPVFKVIFNTVPAVKFLRAPSLIMFMFSAATSVLGAYFVNMTLADRKIRHRSLLMWLLAALIVLTFLTTVARGMAFSIWNGIFGSIRGETEALRLARSMLLWDGFRLAVFAVPLIVIMLMSHRGWKRIVILGIAAVGLLSTSLPHSMKFVRCMDRRDFERRDPVINYLKEDRGIYRVLPLTGSRFYNTNFLPIFGIETSNGFYDNRIRYYDLLVGEGFRNLTTMPNVLRVTNTRYVILSQPIDHPLLTLRKQFGNIYLYENVACLPRCFIAHSAVIAETDSAALELLGSADFDVSNTVIITGAQPILCDSIPSGEQVEIVTYEPDHIVIRAVAKQPGYLVYSGNYLPYWKATVDGDTVPVIRCNISMVGIYLDPGSHVIELRYRSKWYDVGRWIFAVGCIGIILPVVVSFLRWSRRRSG